MDDLDINLRNIIVDIGNRKLDKMKLKLESLKTMSDNIQNNNNNNNNSNNSQIDVPETIARETEYHTEPPSTTATPPVHSFHARTLYLMNEPHQFTSEEMNMLDCGLKYSPPREINFNDIVQLTTSVDSISDNEIIQTDCSRIITSFLRSSNNNSKARNNFIRQQQQTLNSLKRKVSEQNLIVIKADKGNCTVVLDKQDYMNKVNSFLLDNSYAVLLKDPTEDYQNTVRQSIKSTTSIFHVKFNKSSLINMNPLAPRLYGAPKVHKSDIPIRPVVSFCSSPSEKLAKFLNKKFYNLTNFEPMDSVKNSLQFIQLFQSVYVPDNAILVSFDVVNLFTNVPKYASLNILNYILRQHSYDKIVNQEFMNLFEVCFNQNYFYFDKKYYSGGEGLAMGAPLSCLGADAFMHWFYKEFVNHRGNPFKQFVYKWRRYVDDVFCIWIGSLKELDQFLIYMNKCYSTIKFTCEIEKNKKLNYLDLTITRNNNSLTFEIFRKPTATDSVIHADSLHPWTHKMAAFHSMVHRLLSYPLEPTAYGKELSIIKLMAVNNGYETNMIDRLIDKRRRRIVLNVMGTLDNEKKERLWCSIPFVGEISVRLSNVLERNGFSVSFNASSTLRSHISKVKDPVELKFKSGVYIIECGGCAAQYLGQTGRNLRSRVKEHMRDDVSSFYQHITQENHKEAEHQAGFVHVVSKGRKMDSLEKYEILRSQRIVRDLNLNVRTAGSMLIRTIVSEAPPLKTSSVSLASVSDITAKL